jgi:hypothetical protein
MRTFLNGLTEREENEAVAAIKMLMAHGSQLRHPHSSPLGNGLFELRRGQVRIVYMYRPGKRALLFDGIIKKRDDLPRDFVKRMEVMRQTVLERDRRQQKG